MEIRLSDAEMKIMEILWRTGEERAAFLADAAQTEIGWEKNTTYTLLNRLIKKGAIRRRDPGFYCEAVYDRDAALSDQARDVVGKLYNGSLGLFVQSFLDGGTITPEEKETLWKLIDRDGR